MLQGDLNLNICEAHAFNSKDNFSLDVFVVSGWSGQGTSDLEDVLSERLEQLPQPMSRLSLDSAHRNNDEIYTSQDNEPPVSNNFLTEVLLTFLPQGF